MSHWSEESATAWQSQGQYEYEYDVFGYTHWCRCKGGRLASGHWPEFNNVTGETRNVPPKYFVGALR